MTEPQTAEFRGIARARARRLPPVPPAPENPEVAIAVLFERMGHVIARLDDMNSKLDRKFSHAEAQTAELERRVEKIEKQVERARGFMIGAACAGGFAGGGAAALIGQMFGG
jgi:hypothetical protein